MMFLCKTSLAMRRSKYIRIGLRVPQGRKFKHNGSIRKEFEYNVTCERNTAAQLKYPYPPGCACYLTFAFSDSEMEI